MFDNGYVYFIKCEQYIKIGYSKYDPSVRLQTMQSGNPFDLIIVGYLDIISIPQNKDRDWRFDCQTPAHVVEEFLHIFFKDYHYKKEWFFADPILEWLDYFSKTKPLLIEGCNCKYKEGAI